MKDIYVLTYHDGDVLYRGEGLIISLFDNYWKAKKFAIRTLQKEFPNSNIYGSDYEIVAEENGNDIARIVIHPETL